MHVDTINNFILPGFLAYLLTFFSLLSNMVPISLYFCLEILNRMNKYLLGQDRLMFHEETNKRADCRTGNLIAEIGQVTHVFSDKTGTLTNNEMRLVSCSVGKIYGKIYCLSKAKTNSVCLLQGSFPQRPRRPRPRPISLRSLRT